MCGIVYAQSFDGTPVNVKVFDQYVNQRSRGKDGFGLFTGKHLFHAALEERIINWLAKEKNESDMLLFHHRFPTSTINVKRAAHPFTTKDYYGDTEYVLIHNGTISNSHSLKAEHEKLGITYHSILQDGKFNDSEALLWDFAQTMEGKQDKLTAYGMIAFICMKLVNGKPEKLFFGRNTRPLNLKRNKRELFLSSEGEGEAIIPDQLYTFNYKLKRLTKRFFKIRSFEQVEPFDWSKYNANNNNVCQGSSWSRNWNDNRWDDDEYDDYPTYGGRKFTDQKTAATSIGNYLRSKYRGLVDDDIPTYEWDDDAQDLVQVFSEQEEIDRLYNEVPEPEPNHVRRLANLYLVMNNGCFQQALWHVSEDLDELLDKQLDENRVKQQKVLERVQAHIESDPEYYDENSVSSDYIAGRIYAS